jgi:peptidyl-dipeptidase A
MTSVTELLAETSARLAPLDRAAGLAWWEASTDVSPATEAARVVADLALRDAYADPELYRRLTSALHDAGPTEARRLRVLADGMRTQQVPRELRREIATLEAAIDSTFNSFRGTLDGVPVDDNTLIEILRSSDDGERRRCAWEAAKEIGAVVAEDIRHLAHLRNEAARSVGARDHFALTLETSELDEDDLLSTLAAVEDVTRAPFIEWKAAADAERAARFGIAVDDLAPWHYDDPFFQAPPGTDDLDLAPWFADLDQVTVTRATYAGIGIDIAPILERSDLLPRDRKSQHAFCIDIDRGEDIRVLANLVPGEQWTETMLHEFGHAVYDAGVSADLDWPVRTMHPLTTEGVAMLFGRLSLDPEWLVQVAGVPAAEVAAAIPALARRRMVALLVFARWVLVMTNFERELYADPDADHDRRWWDLVEQHQLLTRPGGRRAPDWAAKIHVALAPVYYQNYLLGELVASQLQATLLDRCGGIVGRPAAGELLGREVFAPGWSMRWDELIARATGSPLTVDAFAAELRTLRHRAEA